MFGINGAEVLVLLLVAVIVVGPERLPAYAEQLARWTRSLRTFAGSAKERVASELGDEAGDVDWASLDPRRYDPRRIVREALLDEVTGPARGASSAASSAAPNARGAAAGAAAAAGSGAGAATASAPFDDEAT